MKRTTVWLDHHEALIFDYAADGVHKKTFECPGDGRPSKAHLEKFYHDLANKLADANLVLVLGPGMAKEEFKNHCESHHPKLNKAIFSVETMKTHTSHEEILRTSNELYKKHFDWAGI